MNTAFLIYLVMQLDSINDVLSFFVAMTFLGMGAAIVFNVGAWLEVNDSGDKVKAEKKENLDFITRIRKKAVAAFVILVLIVTLTPSTKTAIYMIGGSATIEALQSEEAKEIGGKVLELLQKKLDEELGK